uniref:BAH domain-containing protein n=1 Tax=Mesocestoides corti TaxID=53468 RepID=A0A5K3G0W4_MESCO
MVGERMSSTHAGFVSTTAMVAVMPLRRHVKRVSRRGGPAILVVPMVQFFWPLLMKAPSKEPTPQSERLLSALKCLLSLRRLRHSGLDFGSLSTPHLLRPCSSSQLTRSKCFPHLAAPCCYHSCAAAGELVCTFKFPFMLVAEELSNCPHGTLVGSKFRVEYVSREDNDDGVFISRTVLEDC